MLLAAYAKYRAFVEAVYPELLAANKIYTLDHNLRFTEAVQGVDDGEAVQLYAPNLVGDEGGFTIWEATLDVLASSVDKALTLADPLTTALQTSTRYPASGRAVRITTSSGSGWALVRAQYRFRMKPILKET